ncbi:MULTISPECIES: efflux RND transporter permease subunit [unclassified Novosphingobium]|uniref:efflux RND transporter permease subunit n=1 Tax=unclassified Novosphingobium TaxID=2644732 RepID=UPI000F5DAE88|nr:MULTISPECIES: efflux RND transporter permease subunit [unclassified Novosphingobium]MBF5092772.1 efflux RND transporter permease subunit [Novosphingobium sp. NBM11]RQW42648.1 efflux RND transporter permease subunit [Novosphingobium sp. LASN5T]
MLSFVVRQSLRHAWTVLVLALALLGLGAMRMVGAAYDVFPEFVPPQASIQTEAPGYTPRQVEMLITRPLEAVINGANGVETVRSESIQGLSVIDVTFHEGVDPYRARQQVSEALADAIPQLPAGSDTPRITPLTSSTMDLLKIGFTSDRLSPMALRDLVEWTVRPRLLAAPGVARANVFGGEQRRIEVRADPARLLARSLTFADLAGAVDRAIHVNGGGFADTPSQRILIDPGPSAMTARQIADGVLSTGSGGTVRIGDVAQVIDAAAPRQGDALIMGRPGVLMTLSSQYGANTLQTTRNLEAALAEVTPALTAAGVRIMPAMHRPANFIESALGGIERDLVVGALMIALVLMLILRDWRVTLIAFVSIPLSLLAALVTLDAMGQTINTMTLGGLAVALGVVIDDAIVDIENIVRRLRGVPDSANRRAIIEAASIEVRAPVVYATFVLALTMVPVILLTGLQGAFFAPLGLAFLLATMASLLVALTVTPALALLFLHGHEPRPEPAFLHRLKQRHERLVARLMQRPAGAALAIGLLGAVALAGALSFGAELLPSFRERHYVLQVSGPAGASFDWMRATGERISRGLLAIPEVLSVEEQIGRAEAGEDTWPPHRGEFHVRLKPDVDGAGEDRALARMRKVLADTPALQSEVTTFLGDRISESLSGETAAVSISVHGADLDTLDRVAAAIATQLRALPTAADVRVKTDPGTPMLGVTLDPARMALRGVSGADAGDAIRATFAGQPAGVVALPDRTVDVAVTVPEDQRRDPEALGQTLVRTASGGAVRLADIATIALGTERLSIAHEGGQRRQVVTANVTDGDVSGFVSAAKARIARNIHLPPGVFLSWAGAAEGQAKAARQLGSHVLFTAVAMVILLVVAFGGLRPALLILAGMPLAMAGGVLAVALTGGVISLGSLVGFITLFGISARNAILLVAHVDELVARDGLPWTIETVLRATRERVTPIVLTALVTAFALAPLAWESGQSGREVQGPMALVILGGLATSLVLSLLLLPALIWRWRYSPEKRPSA